MPYLLESFLIVARFVARHKKARIFQPAVEVGFDNLVHISANAADQQEVWIRKNSMEDIADASANNDGDTIFYKNPQPLLEGKIIKIEFPLSDLPIVFRINQ